ncbi:MAG: two-component regulator propeller domain-containing protein [Acidobacteriota bacterium]
MFTPKKVHFVLVITASLFLIELTTLFAQDDQLTPAVPPTSSQTIAAVKSPTPTPLPGAQNFHRWGSITVFNGLPSDSVRAVAQTPDGIMWFGTDNGLARFDGRRVQNFTLGEGDSNRVLVMKADADGRIWIGTQNGAFVFSQNRSQLISGTENAGVQSILIGDENFLGSDSGYVYRVDESTGVPTTRRISDEQLTGPDTKPIPVTGIVKYNGLLLVAGYGRGVLIFRDGKFSEFSSTPRPLSINSLAVDNSGGIWVGTDASKGLSGIFRLQDAKAERIAASTASVWPLEADDTGVWAGTARYGLFHVKAGKPHESFTFGNTSGGLRSDTIYSIFTDREGVVWIGTNRGVNRYDPEGIDQRTFSDIPNSNFIRTFTRMWSTNAFVGTNRGLFARSENGSWKEVQGLKNKVIYTIGNLTDGAMVVGTPEGMFDLSGKKVLDGDVRGFATFGGHFYAAVFGRGLVDFSKGNPILVFADTTVTSVSKLVGDRLWIGTAGHGLFKFDGTTTTLEAGPDVLKSGTIWNIFDSGPDELLIAGEHGVFLFNSGKVERIISAEDVRDVSIRDGQVWAATTTQGLLRARRDERLGWLVSSVGFEQGMPSEKAFVVRPAADEVIAATNRGLVYYYPHKIAPKLIPIRILSQRSHDPSELKSTIALEYPQNSILVEVAGLSSRTFPEEFQYSFLLKNAGGDVVDQRFSNDPQYDPTDLKPGDYTIESVAFDRDLNESDPLLIRLSIAKAPFPLTATALGVLLAIAVIGLVWAVFEHRRIRQRNRELAAARLDLANEAERERSRIARDLHDQTLADLRTLMMRSDKGELSQPELRDEIESVSTEIRRICEDLSPSVLENVGLVPALEFLLSQTIENHSFAADAGIEERLDLPLNAQLQIYRIAQEILTNIKRHSNARLVEMSVRIDATGEFCLAIRDDGAPFEPAGGNGVGRGINNVKGRASMINASVSWSARREGNSFTLRIDESAAS